MTDASKAADMAEDGLLPCPFCGVLDLFTEMYDFASSYVVCNNCGSRGAVECQDDDGEDEPGRDAAIRAWNTRTALSTKTASTDVMRDKADD